MPEELPEWIKEFKRRTALIDVIILAFQSDCQCEVCKKLREIAKDLGEYFLPKK